MKCAIMQPTYLPWAGYFNLMASVDSFVFLDDVQYERSSWQNRNRVLVNGTAHWITVPAVRNELSQPINTVEIDDTQLWRRKHGRLLEQTYGKHPFGKEALEMVEIFSASSLSRLVDMNIRLIDHCAGKLGIKARTACASELNIEAPRSVRLVKICQHLSCEEYLSPIGSADYLAEDGVFDKGPVKLSFQAYDVAPYKQKGSKEFVSHLSIVDVVANLGWEQAAAYVRGEYAGETLMPLKG